MLKGWNSSEKDRMTLELVIRVDVHAYTKEFSRGDWFATVLLALGDASHESIAEAAAITGAAPGDVAHAMLKLADEEKTFLGIVSKL